MKDTQSLQIAAFVLVAFVGGTLLGGFVFNNNFHTDEQQQRHELGNFIPASTAAALETTINVVDEHKNDITAASTPPVLFIPSGSSENVDWNDEKIRAIILPKSTNPLQYIGEARLKEASKDRKKRLSEEWMNASTKIALDDGRALITAPHAMIHAGHGNSQFVLAGIVALASRFNLLPVIPCRKFGKLHTSPFYNFHCVDTRYVKWKGLSDGTPSNIGLAYQAEIEMRAKAKPPINTFINGYMQQSNAISYARDEVCWAQRPDEETQKKVMEYWDSTVLGNLSAILNEDTPLVAVHVRRGDYVSDKKKELHGALSVDYYRDAWTMIQGRVGLERSSSAKKIVVLVFAASGTIDWAEQNLKFPGAWRVVFVKPHQGGRGPAADIDILAMSLADYYILANSTFCWWAHFYATCRQLFTSWWGRPWSHKRMDIKNPVYILPHRWHKARDTRYPLTYTFMQGQYMIPNTKQIFEGFED
eukprot:m.340958 g.340958  ORF g.340958 m.340958 type:complete len:475 (+) comp19658_c0_seq1:122-1546(+)